MSNIFVILGMHRSGTSLVSSMIHQAGVPMCRFRCAKGTTFQPYGHFEDDEFKALNRLVIYAAGGSWDNPPTQEQILESFPNFRNAMITLLHYRSANKPNWGWKDPRTILVADHWEDLILSQGYTPFYIFTQRKKEQVVKSLLKRNKKTEKEWGDLYDLYATQIKRFKEVTKQKYIELDFSTLTTGEPLPEVDKLARFIGDKSKVQIMADQIRRRHLDA